MMKLVGVVFTFTIIFNIQIALANNNSCEASFKSSKNQEYLSKVALPVAWNNSINAIQAIRSQVIGADYVIKPQLVAMLSEKFVLINGEAGAAKTMAARLLFKYALAAIPEQEKRTFLIQFHKMLSEKRIIGSLKITSLEKGLYEIETSDSLVADKNLFLIADEVEKAPPGVIMSLLSVMNEKKAFLGYKVVNAILSSGAFTSNKTISEQIDESPQERASLSALFDRMAVKVHKLNFQDTTTDAVDMLMAIEFNKAKQEVEKTNDSHSLPIFDIQVLKDQVKFSDELWYDIASFIHGLDAKLTTKLDNSNQPNERTYFPANQFSNRSNLVLIDLIKSSFIVDKLMNSENINDIDLTMTRKDLHHIIVGSIYQSKLHIQHKSIEMDKDITITQSHGELALEFYLTNWKYNAYRKDFSFTLDGHTNVNIKIDENTKQIITTQEFLDLPKVVKNYLNSNESIENLLKQSKAYNKKFNSETTEYLLEIESSIEKILNSEAGNLIPKRTKEELESINEDFNYALEELNMIHKSPKLSITNIKNNAKTIPTNLNEKAIKYNSFLKENENVITYSKIPLDSSKFEGNDFAKDFFHDHAARYYVNSKRLELINKNGKSINFILKNKKFEAADPVLDGGYSIVIEPATKSILNEIKLKRDLILSNNKKIGLESTSDFKPYYQMVVDSYNEMTAKLTGLDYYLKALLKTTLAKEHLYVYGPPGGAKTFTGQKFYEQVIKTIPKPLMAKINEHIYERFKEEEPEAFEIFMIQFHKQLSSSAITGYEKLNAAKEGRSEYDYKNSIAGSRFLFAILDEVEKGHPGVHSALLSVFNEREIFNGNENIKLTLLSALMTSNQVPSEFLESFGLDLPTGLAFFDRAFEKVFVANKFNSPEETALFLKNTTEQAKIDFELPLPILMLEPLIDNIRISTSAYMPLIETFRLYSAERLKVEEDSKEAHLAQPNLYRDYTIRTMQASDRSMIEFALRSIKAEFLVSQIANGVSYKDLRWEIEFKDLYLANSGPVTRAPHEFSSKFNEDGHISFQYNGAEVAKYENNPGFDQRNQYTVSQIRSEGETFARVLNSVLDRYLTNYGKDILANPQFFPSLFSSQKGLESWAKTQGIDLEQVKTKSEENSEQGENE